MRLIKQNTTGEFTVYMGSSGLTVTATLKKAGGSFSAVAPTITDEGNGYYTIAPIAAHRDTFGVNSWLFSASGVDSIPYVEQVAAIDVEDAAGLGLSRLDAAVSSRNSVIPNNAGITSIIEALAAGVTLTSSERSTLAGAIEVEFLDDLSGEAFLAGIQSSIQALFDQGVDVPVATLVGLIKDPIIAALPSEPLDSMQTQDAAAAALEAIHLDHLLAAAYDPASKPGNAAGLLNVIVESDSGVPRATANFLELAPSGGGGGDAAAIAALVLAGLGSLTVDIVNPYSETTSTLTIVQRADYLSGSILGPLRFKVVSAGVAEGDSVRFGATCAGESAIAADGTIVSIDGDLYAEVELNHTDHTNVRASSYWRFELEHVTDEGVISPLIADSKMTVIPSHAETP